LKSTANTTFVYEKRGKKTAIKSPASPGRCGEKGASASVRKIGRRKNLKKKVNNRAFGLSMGGGRKNLAFQGAKINTGKREGKGRLSWSNALDRCFGLGQSPKRRKRRPKLGKGGTQVKKNRTG